MFRKLLRYFDRSAAVQLPGEEVDPKPPSKRVVGSPYIGRAATGNIPDSSINITNLDTPSSIRAEGTLGQVVKRLVVNNPDAANAAVTKITSAITNSYTIIAYDAMGHVDVQATEIAQALSRHWDIGSHNPKKYTPSSDFRSLAGSLLYDSLRYGAMGLELVLGKGRLPWYLNAIPIRLVKWAYDSDGEYPTMPSPTGETIPLDYPTIFYSSSIQDRESPYAESPMTAAVQACLWDGEFINELRRAATKNLMPRLKMTIKTDAYKQTLPMDILSDATALEAHMDATISKLESQLNGLAPEDALVLFDILEADTIQDSNRSEDRTMQVLHNLINGRVAAGVKILPSVIGRGVSSSAASTESLLYLKAIAAVQMELNILLSRAMTMAVRLYGKPVYVDFKFKEVNLRPDLELASFRAIEQSTVLEQLSLGMTSDVEAVLKLTGNLPPVGYKPLSGTMFKYGAADTSGNSYSNTSVSADGKPDSTQNTKETQAPNEGVKSK
jgi:hypothetical protein